MKKTMFLGLFSLVFLSTVVVLGSSSDFVRDFTRSVGIDAFLGKLSADAPSGDSSKKWEEFRERGFNNEPQRVERKEIPEHVLWRIILAKPEQLKARALKSGSDPHSQVIEYLTTEAKLSPENVRIFTQISADYLAAIKPIDDRMEAIAKGRKALRENPKKVSRDQLVSTNKEFMELQERHNQIALSYKEQFRNAVSPDSYAAFEQWLTTEFAQSITYFSGGSGAKPESFNVGPGKPRNGFEPIQETENSEVKP